MNQNIKEAINKLKEKDIDFELIKLKKKALSAKDVVKYSDREISLNQVCKTIVLHSKEKFLAVLLPGDKNVDLEKIKEKFGLSDLRLAKPKELEEKWGMKPGGVCPLLLDIPLIIDESVFEREKVNFGSGDLNYGIEMKPQKILEVTKAEVSRVAE